MVKYSRILSMLVVRSGTGLENKILINILKVIKEGRQSELNLVPLEVKEIYFSFAIKEGLIYGLKETKDGFVDKPEITLIGY